MSHNKKMDLESVIARSKKIRARYHQLERLHHTREWTVEEDALAFLTDAGLVGRLTMARQGSWPQGENAVPELEHKLGECFWWLMILADRMDIDSSDALEKFLTKTESLLEE